MLATELDRWSSKSWQQLLSDLADGNVAYEVVYDSKTYQVEADLLENTQDYMNVCISVDDGSLPQSFFPASRSFIRKKAS